MFASACCAAGSWQNSSVAMASRRLCPRRTISASRPTTCGSDRCPSSRAASMRRSTNGSPSCRTSRSTAGSATGRRCGLLLTSLSRPLGADHYPLHQRRLPPAAVRGKDDDPHRLSTRPNHRPQHDQHCTGHHHQHRRRRRDPPNRRFAACGLARSTARAVSARRRPTAAGTVRAPTVHRALAPTGRSDRSYRARPFSHRSSPR